MGHTARIRNSRDNWIGKIIAPQNNNITAKHFHINVEQHPLFNRDGDNLYYRTKLSFTQAILGDEIKIRTIDGETTIKIPPGTQPNTNFRIKGKGMPSLERRERGSLYVLVEIDIPSKLTKGQAELLKKFKNA